MVLHCACCIRHATCNRTHSMQHECRMTRVMLHTAAVCCILLCSYANLSVAIRSADPDALIMCDRFLHRGAVRCGAVQCESLAAAQRKCCIAALPRCSLRRTCCCTALQQCGRLTVRPILPFTEYKIRQVRADAVPRHDPIVGAGAARRALGRLQPRPRCVAPHRIRRSIIRCCSATTLHR
jgi:hypothetical protein